MGSDAIGQQAPLDGLDTCRRIKFARDAAVAGNVLLFHPAAQRALPIGSGARYAPSCRSEIPLEMERDLARGACRWRCAATACRRPAGRGCERHVSASRRVYRGHGAASTFPDRRWSGHRCV